MDTQRKKYIEIVINYHFTKTRTIFTNHIIRAICKVLPTKFGNDFFVFKSKCLEMIFKLTEKFDYDS